MRIIGGIAVAIGLALAGCSSTPPPAGNTGQQQPSPTAQSSRAPGPVVAPEPTTWALPADASAAARAAGLPMLGEEKLAVHYHAHLDIVINGTQIPVPASIGIDQARGLIAPLHTHEPDGIVHIESATDIPFTLGQLFTAWGQPLRADRVGPHAIAAGEVLRVFNNGKPVSGDPGALRLTGHAEVVIWVGPATVQPSVPATFRFPPGT